MTNVKYITIGGFDFIITKEIDFNNHHYMIAIDEKGENTISVLQRLIIDGKEVVQSVEDDEELEMVLELANRENN